MIINTGNRTDIPAFFSEWFINRLRDGFVLVRNPYNPQRITRYELNPRTVDGFVFCTKNPAPMLDKMEYLKSYRQCWFVTITPYGKSIEPNVPDKHEILNTFRKLSEKVGKECIIWRYDPILLYGPYTIEYHKRAFETMAKELHGTTETCIISFIDLYEKTKKNFPEVKAVSPQAMDELAVSLKEIADRYGMKLRTCLEDSHFSHYGIDTAGCSTKEVLEKMWNIHLKIQGHPETREGCECILGNDIGAYNTCSHGCRYCYANYDMKMVYANTSQHDPHSPLLIGYPSEKDEVVPTVQHSWIDRQISLFDGLS